MTPSPPFRTRLVSVLLHLVPPLLLLAGLALAAGCGTTDAPSGPAVFEFEVTGETFRVRLDDPNAIAAAEARLAARPSGVVSGRLAHGDGGFNAPYRWHLVPESVHFPDVSAEACSGRPRSDVEADPAYWVDVLSQYCPWGATLVRRID